MSRFTTPVIKYSRVKSNVLAPVSRDPVLQHMSAWHLRQHELRVRSARPWEQAHVNPGRHRKESNDSLDVAVLNVNNQNLSRNSNKRPSSCTRLTHGNTPTRQNGKTIRNTTPTLGPQHIKWQAHAASHAKQASGEENEEYFQPRILETNVTSRLRNSRHYQQPRSRKLINQSNTGNNKAANGSCAEVSKAWVPPSSCSSSSSGDSAYEAGGSSPPSRGSTPRVSRSQSHPLVQSRQNSGPASCSSEHSQHSNKQSQTDAIVNESPHDSVLQDVATSPLPWQPSRSFDNEDLDIAFTPINPLPRNEDLAYAMFEHDLMNEIVSAGLLTNSAVKQVCRAHMAAFQGRLEQEKMEEIISSLHRLLDVPSDDNFDLACFGLGSSDIKTFVQNPTMCTVVNSKKCTLQDSIDDAPQLADEVRDSLVVSEHSDSQLEELSDDDNPATYNIEN